MCLKIICDLKCQEKYDNILWFIAKITYDS